VNENNAQEKAHFKFSAFSEKLFGTQDALFEVFE